MDWMKRAQQGDAMAMALLIRRHAPLVQALAMRFEAVQDAFQAGCMGLVKAIRGYKKEMRYAFSTYAVPTILGEMKKTRETPFGWRINKKLRTLQEARRKLTNEKSREPTIEEISRDTGIFAAEIAYLLECSQPKMYYDDDSLGQIALQDPESERWLQQFLIRDVLERMPEKYRELLRLRFIIGESQVTLSKRWHINQSTLSRTEKKARLMFISAWQDE